MSDSKSIVGTFGLSYGTKEFLKFINTLYNPAGTMIEAVKRLRREMGDTFVEQIKWGDYQTILAPVAQWPAASGDRWARSMADARQDLATIPNTEPLSPFNALVHANALDRLDAAVAYCFNHPAAGETEPGIPIDVAVATKDATDAEAYRHAIKLDWRIGKASGVEQLKLTMYCPNPVALKAARKAED